MKIEFDPEKNAKNERERGLSFNRVIDFQFADTLYFVDDRNNYGETRYIAVGYLEQRLHVLCFTEIDDGIRVISFRKANPKEARRYGKAKTLN